MHALILIVAEHFFLIMEVTPVFYFYCRVQDRQGKRVVLCQSRSELRSEWIGTILGTPVALPSEVGFLFTPDFFCNLGTCQHEWPMRMKWIVEDALCPRPDTSGYISVWKNAVLADTRKFGGLTAAEALSYLGRIGEASVPQSDAA